MKIEIDLRGLVNEDGNLEDYIVEEIKESVLAKFSASIKDHITKIISEELKVIATIELQKQIEGIFPDALDKEFIEVDSWGNSKKTWTLRQKIIQQVGESAHYKSDGGYNKNTFATLVDKTVKDSFEKFKLEAFKEIDGKFVNDCIDAAEKRIKERIGIK